LVYYMSYDKLAKESNNVMNNIQQDPKPFLEFLQKITSSLKYFRRNFDYKGSESYLERYQTLHNNVTNFVIKHIQDTIREVNDKILMNFLRVLDYLKNNEEAPDNKMVKTVADIDIDLLYYTQSSCRYFKIKDVVEYMEQEGTEIQPIYEYYLNKRRAILTYLFDDLFEFYSDSHTLSQSFSSILTYLKTIINKETTFFYAHFMLVPKKYNEFVHSLEESVIEFLQNLIYKEQSFEEICVSSDISSALMERSIAGSGIGINGISDTKIAGKSMLSTNSLQDSRRLRRNRKGRRTSTSHGGNITETFVVRLQKIIDEKLSVLAHYKFLEFFDHAGNIGEEVVKFTEQIMKNYESNKSLLDTEGEEVGKYRDSMFRKLRKTIKSHSWLSKEAPWH